MMNYTSIAGKQKKFSILGTAPEEVENARQGSDRVLLVSFIVLMLFGMMAVYSAIAYFAQTKGTTAGALFANHSVKLILGFTVMLIASKINYHHVIRWSRYGVLVSWILLLVVMTAGDTVFGARRSLSVAGFSFQPSSLAAVSLLLYISGLIAEKQSYIREFERSFVPIMVWISVTCGLIAIEDFSSAALLFMICFLLMFVGRVPLLHLGGIVAIGVAGSIFLVSSSPERVARVQEYVDQIVTIRSAEFETGEGYQSQQAQIAIAQGGLTGVGIGKSTQRDFLPAPYNDFIFAIVTEEYGLIGALTLLGILATILVRGLWVVARRAEDEQGALVALAATLMITLYGFIHAGVSTGILPVTGLPMPFMSYGGSSILFTGLMAGILLNVSKHTTDRERPYIFG